MSLLSLQQGRIQQKLKTRERLLAVANELMVKGEPISVDRVAQAAGLSKATAYRYFPDTEHLKREASLQLKAIPSHELFAGVSPTRWEERLETLVDYHLQLFLCNEAEFRLFLSSVVVLSKDPGTTTGTRGGRRLALIEEALLPLRASIDPLVFGRLLAALSVFFGMESITVLKDLCHLDAEAIRAVWQWSARALIQAAQQEGGARATNRPHH
jgi:AcrR family transcriptional regulator